MTNTQSNISLIHSIKRMLEYYIIATHNLHDIGISECGICMEDNKRLIAIKCGHILCVTCYIGILKYSALCPYCREQIVID